MNTEVKVKLESKQRAGVDMRLEDVPPSVHNRLKRYQKRISADRNKKYTIKQAYVEFLKEAIKVMTF